MNNNNFNQSDESLGQFGFPGWHHENNFGPPPFGPPPFRPPDGPPPFGPPPAGSVPIGPPPNFSPPIPAWQQGSRGISSCLYSKTYIWLNNGKSFWFFPTHVDRQIIIGYRWRRRQGWTYHAINRYEIRSYQCFK